MTGIGLIGLGRVGRCLLRTLGQRGLVQQVRAIAEVNPGGRDTRECSANLAYLLAYDSVYGPYPGRVEAQGASLVVDGHQIPLAFTSHPHEVEWAGLGAELVIEASGDKQAASEAHGLLGLGVKKVLFTRSAAAADVTLVRGLNLGDYDPGSHHFISCSTCTANALAPVLRAIHAAFGVRRGAITTVHPALSGDTLLDGPAKDFNEGRSGLGVRTVTSEVARTTGGLLPELAGRLSAMSFRTPTPIVNALIADLVLENPPPAKAEVLTVLQESVDGPLAGVVALEQGFLGRPLAASDFMGNSHSAVVDLHWLELNGEMLRLIIWHDNEYAYCCRVADILEHVLGRLE